MKLPGNWKDLREQMVERMTYLRWRYNVHNRLIINLDQTCILYLPTNNFQTWTPMYKDNCNKKTKPQLSPEQAAVIMNNPRLTDKQKRRQIKKETINYRRARKKLEWTVTRAKEPFQQSSEYRSTVIYCHYR